MNLEKIFTTKLNGKYFLAFIKSGLFLAFSVGFMSLGCKIFSLLHSKYCMLRPSCYNCNYCTTNRCSDFTIGDFWGIEKTSPEFNDGDGVSLVICHTHGVPYRLSPFF